MSRLTTALYVSLRSSALYLVVCGSTYLPFQAFNFFSQAADQRIHASAEAWYYLGYMLHNGLGRTQDLVKGNNYYENAAKEWYLPAFYQLGQV